MLQLSYKESSTVTFSALSKQLEDFNNRNVVELAKLGENKYFIAHACCQKWLTQRWFGNIHIRELDWGGAFKLPDGIKVRFWTGAGPSNCLMALRSGSGLGRGLQTA